jgi:glycosyltransferase involved in cell wall biosynthesis
MIVRNEAPVIRRCLDSVIPVIDAWAIVDTGSTDGTQDILREHLAGIPGTLIERPWQNFEVGRNQALDLARASGCDYALFVDADEVLRYASRPELPELESDAYVVRALLEDVEVQYARTLLVRLSVPFKWRGAVHEFIAVDDGQPVPSHSLLENVILVPHYDGHRGKDQAAKAEHDVARLREEIAKDPTNARAYFYLAQTFRGAGRAEDALAAYAARAGMEDAPNKFETWYSKYQFARMSRSLEHPLEVVASRYEDAIDWRPNRAEAFYELAALYREAGKRGRAYAYAHAAADMPLPSETFMVDQSVYGWRAMFELSTCAALTGRLEQAIAVSRHLIDSGKLPPEHCLGCFQNLRKCREALRDANATP